MPLDIKEKELAAVGISIATGCKPCTNYHVKKTREAGASDEEMQQAIGHALNVRNTTTNAMDNFSRTLLGAGPGKECACVGEPTRQKELVAVGAAFAVNCTANLEKHIKAARSVGITEDEIKEILDLALFIKGKGASHVDHIAEKIGKTVSGDEKTDKSCSCG